MMITPAAKRRTHMKLMIAASLIRSIASSLESGFSPSLWTNTRRGVEIARLIRHPAPLERSTARKSLIPPAVDPAAPPMTMAPERISLVDSVQSGRFSTVANPVQVSAEINWKLDFPKDSRRLLPNSVRLRKVRPMTPKIMRKIIARNWVSERKRRIRPLRRS